jgi:hypothetical protein
MTEVLNSCHARSGYTGNVSYLALGVVTWVYIVIKAHRTEYSRAVHFITHAISWFLKNWTVTTEQLLIPEFRSYSQNLFPPILVVCESEYWYQAFAKQQIQTAEFCFVLWWRIFFSFLNGWRMQFNKLVNLYSSWPSFIILSIPRNGFQSFKYICMHPLLLDHLVIFIMKQIICFHSNIAVLYDTRT